MGALGAIVLVFVGLFGLFVGSFLNVVIWRLPRRCLSVVKQTRSRCPRCGVQLRWFDNIPLFSWLILLRGKCRHCRAPISFRYPLIEASTAAAIVAAVFFDRGAEGIEYPFMHPGGWLICGAHALIIASLIALSVIDIDFQILPNAITIPGIWLAPILAVLLPELMPRLLWQPLDPGPGLLGDRGNALINSLLGAGAASGLLYGIGRLGSRLAGKEAMGFGDVKLIAAMGGLVGLWFPMVLAIASLFGSLIGGVVWIATRKHMVPFGPYLAAGFLVTLFRGPELWNSYLAIFGPR